MATKIKKNGTCCNAITVKTFSFPALPTFYNFDTVQILCIIKKLFVAVDTAVLEGVAYVSSFVTNFNT